MYPHAAWGCHLTAAGYAEFKSKTHKEADRNVEILVHIVWQSRHNLDTLQAHRIKSYLHWLVNVHQQYICLLSVSECTVEYSSLATFAALRHPGTRYADYL
jgi:hypothetical protein